MTVIKQLIFDSWNIAHISRHKVTRDEIVEACYSEPLVQQGNKGRLVIIGSTKRGRMIEVVLDPELESDVYYVVTAHTASKKDRELYRKEKGGENL